MLSCFINSSSFQKLKKKKQYLHSNPNLDRTHFCAQNTVPAVFFFNFNATAKEIFVFQNPYNGATEELPPNYWLEIL